MEKDRTANSETRKSLLAFIFSIIAIVFFLLTTGLLVLSVAMGTTANGSSDPAVVGTALVMSLLLILTYPSGIATAVCGAVAFGFSFHKKAKHRLFSLIAGGISFFAAIFYLVYFIWI